MLLVVDVGNTQTHLGVFRGDELLHDWRFATVRESTADELGSRLRNLLALRDLDFRDLDASILSSTVPQLRPEWAEMAERYLGHEMPVVGPGVRTGMPIRMDNPREVGADRLVNALAVQRLYGTPAVVVDFGTATTLDCVALDGAYVGGAIAPGLELGLEALAVRTAKLPRIELRAPDRAIGRDTIGAMQAGTIFGYQALAAGLLARVRRELAGLEGVEPGAVHAILTGGLSAAPWAAALEGIEAIDPDLTLKGLAILHAEVSGGERLELGLT